MAFHEQSSLVGFDGDAALEAAYTAVGDRLRFAAEYNGRSFRVLYVADWLLDVVGGRDQIRDIGEQFHDYVDVDREVRRLMEELPPLAGDVRANVTRLDNAVFVRYYVGDDALFLTLDTEADVTGLLDALEATVGERADDRSGQPSVRAGER